MSSRSFWLCFSIQFKNANVMWWLKKVKNSSSVINNSHSIHNLHPSRSKLLLYVSTRTFLMIGKTSKSDGVALPSFANIRFWQRNILLTIFSFSYIQSNKSTCEHDLADYHAWPTGIPFSKTFFALKYDFEFGLIFARVPHWSTCFSVLVGTSKFDLSEASTMWLLQSRYIGLYGEFSFDAIFYFLIFYLKICCWKICHNIIIFCHNSVDDTMIP